MEKYKLKILSLALAGISLFSLAGCSLKKDNPYNDTSIVSNMDVYTNIKDNKLRETIDDFITQISNSNIDVDWDFDSFYEKLNSTTFIKLDNEKFIQGSYNFKDNIFKYCEDDIETMRHELIHMLLPRLSNNSLNEGLVQLVLNEVFGYEIRNNVFDASICKIFFRILEKDEIKELLSGNEEILPTKLSSIKPAYSDAKDFLEYMHNSNYYYRELQQNIFNNNLEEYKKGEEYAYLESVRSCIKGRIKVYLKEYYNPYTISESPEATLLEMFEILNIINYDMCDHIVDDGILDNDYFLEENINNLASIYGITEEKLGEIDKSSRNKDKFKYFPQKTESLIKGNS